MWYGSFYEIVDQARGKRSRHRLAVVCAGDGRVLESVTAAAREGIVDPCFIGNTARLRAILEARGETCPYSRLIPADSRAEAAAKAVELVRNGQADFILKGRMETSALLEAVLDPETGISAGGVLSHISLTCLPSYRKILAITDAAMIVEPDLHQKKHIIRNAAEAMHRLGCACPRAAVLAAAEEVCPALRETMDAAALRRMWEAGALPGCIVQGPVGIDLALRGDIIARKSYNSPAAGSADILVMPNMAAGAILRKTLREFANSTEVCVVMGARVPIVLPPHDASVRTRYTSLAVISEMLSPCPDRAVS